MVTSPASTPKIARCGARVDVLAGGERLDQARVLGQVGDDAQFDLVVVRDEELVAVGGHERLPEAPPLFGTDRDVVQVRRVRGQTTGARHRLVERRVDASVGRDLGEQPLAVGGAELLDLSVAQQVLDDRVLAAELLQRGLVGRVTGLGLLAGGETQLVEQDRPHLRGRVDVEVLACSVDDRGALPLGLGGELVEEAAQDRDVDADAEVLHASEHPHQRHLDLRR